MTPVPTPFDIIAPPGIAYVPGVLAWLLAISVALLVAIALLALSRQRRRRSFSPTEALERATREVRAYLEHSGDSISRNELNDISLLLRRLVSVLTQTALDARSPEEIKEFIKLPESQETREILGQLIGIEELRFAPQVDNIKRRELVSRVLEAIQNTQLTPRGAGK